MKSILRIGSFVIAVVLFGWLAIWGAAAQQDQRRDTISIGITGLPLSPLKMAVADFRQNTPDTAPLVRVFNDVLWNDLSNAGIFEMVSKSLYPKNLPGRREELFVPGGLAAWSGPPVNTQALAFGNASMINNNLVVEGYLVDVTNTAHPEILSRRYTDQPTEAAARVIAHRFADAIIQQFGGVPGVAESTIYFCHAIRGGAKEIWAMDYDGNNQRAITHYGGITLSPAPSPDGTRLAFSTQQPGNWEIYVLSLESMRRLSFLNTRGASAFTPNFSPDGTKLAFAYSVGGYQDIYVANADGTGMRPLTRARSTNMAPVWNPKGGQIAFVSGVSGIPQIYVMNDDGTNVRKLTEGTGDAVNPAWAPNGQVLAFSWTRGFAPGNYNVFLMDIASGKLVQLTFGAGANEHPWFSPDGRHIVFESNRNGGKQIFSMLADGTQVRALTSAGINTLPVWSAH